MLNLKKIFLAGCYLIVINTHGSLTQNDDSSLEQAAFLFAKKQQSRQIASQFLLAARTEEAVENPKISSRKKYHRKKIKRAKEIAQRLQHAQQVVVRYPFWNSRRRVNICNKCLE